LIKGRKLVFFKPYEYSYTVLTLSILGNNDVQAEIAVKLLKD